MVILFKYWGISSVGRVLAWHARCQRFKSAMLHFAAIIVDSTLCNLKFEFGVVARLCFKNQYKILIF